MARETPESSDRDDRGAERQGGGQGRRRQGDADRGSVDRGGVDRSRRQGDDRSGSREWRGAAGSERRGGGSEWRPREGREGGYEGGRGRYRGTDGRDARSGDGHGGYRGHSERGGTERSSRDGDNRVYRPRPARKPEPEIPEHIEAGQLDRAARRELLTLSKENADGVARHLVAATEALAGEDLDAALAHAENASRRAGRVAIVREVLGFVHYRRAEWAEALREFRTARRLSGSSHLLPHIADVERGLGRPDRAIELAQESGADSLPAAERVELAIVVSGARRDLGQDEAAVQTLRDLVQASPPQRSWAPRLYYAYADALLGSGDQEKAREWFARANDADKDALTDASDRLAELDGVDITDMGGDDADESPEDDSAGGDPRAEGHDHESRS